MANIKQQKKRNLTNEKKRAYYASFKSAMTTAIVNVEKHVAENNLQDAELALNTANKRLDKAVVKGIIHKNKASRYKSRLSLLINSIR